MKFYLGSLLLLANSASATQLKNQAQMIAEIEAMSLNANMHQISQREKTLIKSYLEVDMNEFIQQHMDSELFEGIDEAQKAQFVGNFFHWVKCRFSDCNLLQTHAKLNTHVKSEQPTIKETNAREKLKDVTDWGSGQGNGTPAHSQKDTAYVQTDAQIAQPTIKETNARE